MEHRPSTTTIAVTASLDRPRTRGRRPAPAAVAVGWAPASPTLAWTGALASVLGATFAAALGLSLAGLAGTIWGWGLLGTAGMVGLAPSAWRRLRPGPVGAALPLWDLEPRLAHLVAAAAGEASVLRAMADRAPSGPVADHLDHLAATAHHYVVALHDAAVQSCVAAGPRPDRELEAIMTRIGAQLADLSAAARRLRQAQRHHLQTSPLEELTEDTDRLTEAVESGQLH